jgi:hypothetical protein
MSVFSNRSVDPPQERAKYPKAVLELVGGRDPLTVLRDTPTAVARAIEGLSPAQLRKPEAPGKWSSAPRGAHPGP